LRVKGLDHRVFGNPLETWRTAMPAGMLLKSDGFASNLSVPLPDSTLEDYCLSHEIPYHATHIPVALETFVEYGLEFQRRFVPHLEAGTVVSITRLPQGFRVSLDDGDELDARHVIVAVGITHFASMPASFEGLPDSLVTHASAHHELDRFAGQDVTVVGAGASAVELAVGLAAVGAHARLVARAPTVKFSSPPADKPRSLAARLRQPSSGLGPGIRSRLCCDAPDLFRYVPSRARAEIVRRHLGPSPPWHLENAFESSVDVMISRTIRRVETAGGRLRLELADHDSPPVTVETDHVICATGYRADIGRLGFLDPSLRDQLRTVNDAPALSFGFESSARGLFFVGLASAMTFGPLMRFMYGDEFAARRVTDRIARTRS
jgi:thioredoxin reductase